MLSLLAIFGVRLHQKRKNSRAYDALRDQVDGFDGDDRRLMTRHHTRPRQEGQAVHDDTYWQTKFKKVDLSDKSFRVGFDSMRLVRQIGHGATCVVHAGWWEERGMPVAVKRFFLGKSFLYEDFCREALMHRDLKHNNVLELLAVTIDPPCSITKFMSNGTVYHLLASEAELTFSQMLRIAVDVCQGMVYLHEHKVVHRDLKTLNLLIDDDNIVKVCDFGIARLEANTMTTGAGSLQYMAPEVFVSGHYTEKADVYSFAIVLWELVTRDVPYADCPTPYIVMSQVRSGKRLTIPSDIPPGYASLMEECWHQDPHSRPTFMKCLSVLQELRLDSTMKRKKIILNAMPAPRPSQDLDFLEQSAL